MTTTHFHTNCTSRSTRGSSRSCNALLYFIYLFSSTFMFVCVTISSLLCVTFVPYFTRSRVPSHISVATSVGNKSIGSMWRERFGFYLQQQHHAFVLFILLPCLAFFQFLSKFLSFIFWSFPLLVPLRRSSRFSWYSSECEGLLKVVAILCFLFSPAIIPFRFQLQVHWEWPKVQKLQYHFEEEVLGYWVRVPALSLTTVLT